MSTRTRYSITVARNHIQTGRQCISTVLALYESYKAAHPPPRPVGTPIWEWLGTLLAKIQPKGVVYKVWREGRTARNRGSVSRKITSEVPLGPFWPDPAVRGAAGVPNGTITPQPWELFGNALQVQAPRQQLPVNEPIGDRMTTREEYANWIHRNVPNLVP